MSGYRGLGAILAGLVCGHLAGLSVSLPLAAAIALAGRERRVLALLFCLGCLRGATFAMASEPGFPRDTPHLGFEVVGMPTIGQPCSVRVHDEPGWEPLRLELREGCADLLPGQRIVVRRAGPPARRGTDGQWRLRRHRALLRKSAGDRLADRGWAALVSHRWRAWELARGRPADALGAAGALGLRTALSPERRTQLRLAGLGHLLAVSGLHVGLVAWLVYRLLRGASGRSLLGLRIAWLTAALPVLFYVVATGASPSAMRAGLMFACLSVGALWGRPVQPRFVLASVGTLMLLCDPRVANEYGFWLSFAAMLAIVSADGIVVMQWRLFWGLAGLNHALFGYVSWIGAVLNLVAVPVFSVAVLPLALLGWALPNPLSPLARDAARPGAQLVLDLAALGSRVDPWGNEMLRILCCVGLASWLVSPWLRADRLNLKRWRPPLWGVVALTVSVLGTGGAGLGKIDSMQSTRIWLAWGTVTLHEDAEGRWCHEGGHWDSSHSRLELSRRAWLELSTGPRRRVQAAHPETARQGLAALPVCTRGSPGLLVADRMQARG